MIYATQSDFTYVENIVLKSKSSFAMGMKVLDRDKRGYLYAIYAYCRILDDIADEIGSQDTKLVKLLNWEKAIQSCLEGKPTDPVTRILADAVSNHQIPSDELFNLIEGMKADILGPIQKPSLKELYKYCRNVAVSVGLLSLPLFGRKDEGAKKFAYELGMALQLTNILRDIDEDLKINRIYLPLELLAKYGVKDITPSENLTNVLLELASLTEQHYLNADNHLKSIGKEGLLPALLMKEAYHKIFLKLKKRGWDVITPRIKLSKMEKTFLIMGMLTKS